MPSRAHASASSPRGCVSRAAIKYEDNMPAATATETVRETIDAGNGEPKYTRLSVNIALDVADMIRTLTRRKGITATEGVRRAIALWKLVEDETAAGGTVQVVNSKTGKVRELVLL